MKNSIPENGYILFSGLLALIFLIVSIINAFNVAKCFEEKGGQKLKKSILEVPKLTEE